MSKRALLLLGVTVGVLSFGGLVAVLGGELPTTVMAPGHEEAPYTLQEEV